MSVELDTPLTVSQAASSPAPKRARGPAKPPAPPRPLALVCERCDRRIRGTGAGFAAVDLRDAHTAAQGRSEKAVWSLLHVDCAPEVVKPLNPFFRIWAERIDTVDGLLDAMADLSRHSWFAASAWGSSLVGRVLADTEVWIERSEATSAKHRQLREQRTAEGLLPGDPRHGTNGYTNYNCRCPVCSDANTTARQRERQRARNAALNSPQRDQQLGMGT